MRSRKLRPGRVILVAVLAVLAGKNFILDAYVVEGPSMRPTLESGKLVLVLRCAYGLRLPTRGGYLLRWASPRRGEVVAAPSPRDGRPVVKRVAAVGPARLAYEAGRLVGPGLDATLSAAQAADIGAVAAGESSGEFELPADSCFLLGDNHADSYDSRDYGPVSMASVAGEVLLLGGGRAP
jgi:signal peptidase I